MDTYTTTIYAADGLPDSDHIHLTHTAELTIRGCGYQTDRLIGVSLAAVPPEAYTGKTEILIANREDSRRFALLTADGRIRRFDSLDAMADGAVSMAEQYSNATDASGMDKLALAARSLYWSDIAGAVKSFRDCWKYVANFDTGGRAGIWGS